MYNKFSWITALLVGLGKKNYLLKIAFILLMFFSLYHVYLQREKGFSAQEDFLLRELSTLVKQSSMPAQNSIPVQDFMSETLDSSPTEKMTTSDLILGFSEYDSFEQTLSFMSAPGFPVVTESARRETEYRNFFVPVYQKSAKKHLIRTRMSDFIEELLLIRKLKESDGITVQELASHPVGENYIRREIILVSDISGSFPVWIYEPKNISLCNGKALLVIHGHTEYGHEKFRSYIAEEFFDAGYIIAVPQMRNMEADEWEISLSRILWLRNYRLMSMRVLELLHTGEFLKNHALNKSGVYAVIGHSGGSVAGTILKWYDTDVISLVFDYQSTFLDSLFRHLAEKSHYLAIHCETIPEFSHYAAIISLEGGGNTMMFDYGYPEPRAAFDFISRFYKNVEGIKNNKVQIVHNRAETIREELDQVINLFSTPGLKRYEVLKTLSELIFQVSTTAFRHYLDVSGRKKKTDYRKWLAAFTTLPFTPQTAGLFMVLFKSAIAEEALDNTLLKDFLKFMSSCPEPYLHDLLLLRFCEFYGVLTENSVHPSELLSLMKSPLAPFYNAIIIPRIFEKRKPLEIRRLVLKMGIKHSPIFEAGLRIWFCGLYENGEINLYNFLKQSEWKGYSNFCVQGLNI